MLVTPWIVLVASVAFSRLILTFLRNDAFPESRGVSPTNVALLVVPSLAVEGICGPSLWLLPLKRRYL